MEQVLPFGNLTEARFVDVLGQERRFFRFRTTGIPLSESIRSSTMSRIPSSIQKSQPSPPPSGTSSVTTIDRILRVSDVIEATGLGRNTIYRWMNEGQFPLPLDLGGCRVGWRQSDIRAWIESRPHVKTIRVSRNAAPWRAKKVG